MSQDLTRRMTTKAEGGKGHTYYVRYNNKNKKDPSAKFVTKKFNKFTRKHEEYKQSK